MFKTPASTTNVNSLVANVNRRASLATGDGTGSSSSAEQIFGVFDNLLGKR